MGLGASMMRGSPASSSSGNKIMVVTLDALGTLYRFKQPVATQYKAIATQCGLKAEISTEALASSFRQAYKSQSRALPNYGKGELASPEEWWDGLVQKSFAPLVGSEAVPADLGARLYRHFSSGSAYELFPDVRPFMDAMARLKANYSDPAGPMLITGVITNSDPRVRQVLGSLGLRVGPSALPDRSLSNIASLSWKQSQDVTFKGGVPTPRTPLHDYYNGLNDFDFLATSYDAGAEKPSGEIFRHAKVLGGPIPWSRFEQKGLEELETGDFFKSSQQFIKASFEFKRRAQAVRWIHIGDDFEKDFEGASAAGLDALLLNRDAVDAPSDSDALSRSVLSLEEAATVVSVMAQQTFAAGEEEEGKQ